jgi:hypothetical protein
VKVEAAQPRGAPLKPVRARAADRNPPPAFIWQTGQIEPVGFRFDDNVRVENYYAHADVSSGLRSATMSAEFRAKRSSIASESDQRFQGEPINDFI